jgi:hypothetical protein
MMNPAERATFDQIEAGYSDVPDTEEDMANDEDYYESDIPASSPGFPADGLFEEGNAGWVIHGLAEDEEGQMYRVHGHIVAADLVKLAFKNKSQMRKSKVVKRQYRANSGFYDFTS